MAAKIHYLHSTETSIWQASEVGELSDNSSRVSSATLPSDYLASDAFMLRPEMEEFIRLYMQFKPSTRVKAATRTVTMPESYRKIVDAVHEAAEQGRSIGLRRPNDIPMHGLLRFGAGIVASLSIASIILWLGSSQILLNPFVALLGLASSPFLYLMGIAAKIKN